MKWLAAGLFLLSSAGLAECKTIGHVNHNPANIRVSRIKWDGQVGHDSWKHVKFATDADGLMAIRKTLISYRRKHKLHTIEDVAARWISPKATDAQRECWAQTVRQRTKTPRGMKLDLSNRHLAKQIARGIVYAENSCDEIPEKVYEQVFSKEL